MRPLEVVPPSDDDDSRRDDDSIGDGAESDADDNDTLDGDDG